MKFSTITTAAALLSAANAFPLLNFGGLFSRSVTPSSTTLKATSNATNSTGVTNTTNSTNSSLSSSSDEFYIKLISFSDEFSDLYYGDNSTELDLTTEEVYEILGLSTKGLTNSTAKLTSLESLLNTTGVSEVDYEQLGDSYNETALLDLYQAILDDQFDYDGIIVLLDPSEIESSAFFVEVMEELEVPIVFTTTVTLSNLLPGFTNLYDSVLVVSDSELNATEAGVLVVADKAIISSLYAVRSTTDTTDTIVSSEGSVGKIYEDNILWFYESFEVPTIGTNFTLDSNTTLPSVAIVEYYDGLSTDVLDAITGSGIDGLVVGAPSITDFTEDILSDLADAADSISIVFANSQGGVVSVDDLYSNSTIAGGILSPIKAKVLLQVALSSEYSTEEIHDLFASAYGG